MRIEYMYASFVFTLPSITTLFYLTLIPQHYYKLNFLST